MIHHPAASKFANEIRRGRCESIRLRECLRPVSAQPKQLGSNSLGRERVAIERKYAISSDFTFKIVDLTVRTSIDPVEDCVRQRLVVFVDGNYARADRANGHSGNLTGGHLGFGKNASSDVNASLPPIVFGAMLGPAGLRN